MPPISRLRVFYLSHLSKPTGDRLVYRQIRRRKVQSILELGIGIGLRSLRMIQVAKRYAPAGTVRYVGVDKFEARSSQDGPGVTLKMAHRLLSSTKARIRLLPGDPFSTLAREANQIGAVDLIVISPRHDSDSLARAWHYLPRLLHERSQVFIEKLVAGGQTTLCPATPEEIAARADATKGRRAA